MSAAESFTELEINDLITELFGEKGFESRSLCKILVKRFKKPVIVSITGFFVFLSRPRKS